MRYFLVFCAVILAGGHVSAGTVWGTVDPGEAPRAAPVHRDACLWRLGPQMEASSGWGEMIVILEGEEAAQAKPAEEHENEILLQGYEIRPRLTVVAAGSTVSFKNQSPRVHSCSAEGPNGFQFSDLKTGATHDQRFLSEGIVEVGCHQFPFMRAKILVVASPLFTKAEPSGRFSFQRVPPGSYRGRVFARGKWRWDKQVNVPDSGLAQVRLGPKVAKVSPPVEPPPERQEPPKPPPEKKPPEKKPPEKKPPEKKPPEKKPPEKKPPPPKKPPKKPPKEEIEDVEDEPTFKDVEPEIEIEEE